MYWVTIGLKKKQPIKDSTNDKSLFIAFNFRNQDTHFHNQLHHRNVYILFEDAGQYSMTSLHNVPIVFLFFFQFDELERESVEEHRFWFA